MTGFPGIEQKSLPLHLKTGETCQWGWKGILPIGDLASWIIYIYIRIFCRFFKVCSSTEGHVGRLVCTGVRVQTPVIGLDNANTTLLWGWNRQLNNEYLLNLGIKKTYLPQLKSALWPLQAMTVRLSVEPPVRSWGREPSWYLILCQTHAHLDTCSHKGRWLKWSCCLCHRTRTSFCRYQANSIAAGCRSCRQKHLDITLDGVVEWSHSDTRIAKPYIDLDHGKNRGLKQLVGGRLLQRSWIFCPNPILLSNIDMMLISCPSAKARMPQNSNSQRAVLFSGCNIFVPVLLLAIDWYVSSTLQFNIILLPFQKSSRIINKQILVIKMRLTAHQCEWYIRRCHLHHLAWGGEVFR